jgi:hypothetical protein
MNEQDKKDTDLTIPADQTEPSLPDVSNIKLQKPLTIRVSPRPQYTPLQLGILRNRRF